MCRLEYDKIMKQSKECMLNRKCSECSNNIKKGNYTLLSCIMNKCYIFIDAKTLTTLDTSELCDMITKIGNPPENKSYMNFVIDEFNNIKDLLIKER